MVSYNTRNKSHFAGRMSVESFHIKRIEIEFRFIRFSLPKKDYFEGIAAKMYHLQMIEFYKNKIKRIVIVSVCRTIKVLELTIMKKKNV